MTRYPWPSHVIAASSPWHVYATMATASSQLSTEDGPPHAPEPKGGSGIPGSLATCLHLSPSPTISNQSQDFTKNFLVSFSLISLEVRKSLGKNSQVSSSRLANHSGLWGRQHCVSLGGGFDESNRAAPLPRFLHGGYV